MTDGATRIPFRRALPAALLLAACLGPGARAAVLSVEEVPLRSVRMSQAGSIDWMLLSPRTWGGDNRLGPCDCSREGRGIARWVFVEGGAQVRPAKEAWPRLGWEDGGRQPVRAVAQDGYPEPGPAEAGLAGGARLVFTFAPPEGKAVRLASVTFLSASPFEVRAVQDGAEHRLVSAAACGVVQVRYGAGGPLELRLGAPAGGGPVVVRGLAAALSGDCAWLVSNQDFVRTFPRTDQAGLLADGARRPAPDFLKLARDYAEAMIRHGRDVAGPERSPLFATLLLRDPPRPGPEPVFAQPEKEWNPGRTEFRRFNYNVCLNYPDGLGSDGPHRVTLFGADPWEDAPLYDLLEDLSRLAGEPRYRREAEASLRWWFANTQGAATGLYPWGAHLGWDFAHESPSYQEGPSRHLYGACWHDVEDGVPGLPVLASMPAEDDDVSSPLLRYARGIRDAHVWDRERFFYSRRGDYYGTDDRAGSPTGSPAALGAFLRVWTAALLQARSDLDRADMLEVLGAAADSMLARAERFGGNVPPDFRTELEGEPPAPATGGSLRLAHHALFAADSLREAYPDLSGRLERAALAGLGPVPPDRARQNLALFDRIRETFLLEDAWRAGPGGAKPPAQVRDLSRFADSGAYAAEIARLLALFRVHGERAYLEAAVSCGKLAATLFCDARSPLPRFFVPTVPLLDYDGKPFPDFSFRGGRLMHAFALLAEAGVDERRVRLR